jgi:RES domain
VPAGGDVFYRPSDPPDMRWQHGEVVEGWYFADTPETAWAEWYRWLAEAGVPPMQTLPRELWRWEVSLPRVADLSTEARLSDFGLAIPRPERADWPAFRKAGDELYRSGWPRYWRRPPSAMPSIRQVFDRSRRRSGSMSRRHRPQG